MGNKNNNLSCGNFIEENIDFNFYKTLFDPIRSKILIYIASYGKMSINEISENFTQDRSVISRHLDLMNRHGIVHKTKINRFVYYEINSEFILDKFEVTTESLKKLVEIKNQHN